MKEFCDNNCNECPIVNHPNNRMITIILNKLLNKFDDGVYEIVENHCPNLTVCYNCRIDDFCHIEGCKLDGVSDENRELYNKVNKILDNDEDIYHGDHDKLVEFIKNKNQENEDHKKLVSKIIEAANMIEKNGRTGPACFIFMTDDKINNIAKELNVNKDEAIEIVKEYFNPKPKLPTDKEKMMIMVYDIMHRSIATAPVGNRDLLAANAMLNRYGISDIETISNFAKFIEKNAELEMNDKTFDLYYDELRKIVREHLNKPFEL